MLGVVKDEVLTIVCVCELRGYARRLDSGRRLECYEDQSQDSLMQSNRVRKKERSRLALQLDVNLDRMTCCKQQSCITTPMICTAIKTT